MLLTWPSIWRIPSATTTSAYVNTHLSLPPFSYPSVSQLLSSQFTPISSSCLPLSVYLSPLINSTRLPRVLFTGVSKIVMPLITTVRPERLKHCFNKLKQMNLVDQTSELTKLTLKSSKTYWKEQINCTARITICVFMDITTTITVELKSEITIVMDYSATQSFIAWLHSRMINEDKLLERRRCCRATFAFELWHVRSTRCLS